MSFAADLSLSAIMPRTVTRPFLYWINGFLVALVLNFFADFMLLW